MSNPSDPNPYLPPQTTSKPIRIRTAKGRPWTRYLGIVQLLIVGIAAPWSYWEIETILASGPCLFFVGIAMAILAYRERNYWTLALGVAAVLYALFVLILINVMSWGPPEAQQPVSIMNLIFASLYVVPLLYGILLSGSGHGSDAANGISAAGSEGGAETVSASP